PDEFFKVNTTYTVTMPLAKRAFGSQAATGVLQYKTEVAPSLADSKLKALEEEAVVASDFVFEVELVTANRDLREMELRTVPEVEMSMSSQDDVVFGWKATELLPQGSAVEVEVYDVKNEVSLLKRRVQVAKEPVVEELAK